MTSKISNHRWNLNLKTQNPPGPLAVGTSQRHSNRRHSPDLRIAQVLFTLILYDFTRAFVGVPACPLFWQSFCCVLGLALFRTFFRFFLPSINYMYSPSSGRIIRRIRRLFSSWKVPRLPISRLPKSYPGKRFSVHNVSVHSLSFFRFQFEIFTLLSSVSPQRRPPAGIVVEGNEERAGPGERQSRSSGIQGRPTIFPSVSFCNFSRLKNRTFEHSIAGEREPVSNGRRYELLGREAPSPSQLLRVRRVLSPPQV